MSELMFPKKNVAFDATLLSSLMGCGRMTDLRFNHNLVSVGGKSNSLETGSIVHKYMEYYYRSLIDGYSKSVAHANGMAAAEMYISGCIHCQTIIPDGGRPICGHQPNEFEGVKNTPRDSEQYKTGWKYVLESCEEYYEHYKNDYWVPLEVEIVKSKVIYEDDEIRVLWKAKIDLMVDTNQAILSVDHKTSKQRRELIKTNNQFMGQCVLLGNRNAVKNNFGFQKSLKPAEKFTRELISFSADVLLEWQSEIVPYYAYQLISYAESGYFPPNFDHCETKYGVCPYYKEICSADRAMREENLRIYFEKAPEWNPVNTDE